MQIAAEVRRGYVKHPKNVKLEHMKLGFSKDESGEESSMTPEEAKRYSDWHKQVLAARWKLKEVPANIK